MKHSILKAFALMFALTVSAGFVRAEDVKVAARVTTIHLDQYNGYFAAQETLAGLKPGDYDFVVQNKAQKTVGFLLQDGKTQEQLALFLLEAGQSRTVRVKINANGFRYRCPINPTPWYEVALQ